MTKKKLFSVLKGSYHDGTLLNGKYENNTLYMYCNRNPPDPEGKEDPNMRYVVIKFDNVTDLEVFDFDEEVYYPYRDDSFYKEDDWWGIAGIYELTCENEVIEFVDCVRFRADDVHLLAHSKDAIDYTEYFDA